MRGQKTDSYHQKLGRGKKALSPTGFKGCLALPTPWFAFLVSRIISQCVSVVLSYLVCGTLLQRP